MRTWSHKPCRAAPTWQGYAQCLPGWSFSQQPHSCGGLELRNAGVGKNALHCVLEFLSACARPRTPSGLHSTVPAFLANTNLHSLCHPCCPRAHQGGNRFGGKARMIGIKLWYMQLVLLRRNRAQSVFGSVTSIQPLGAMNSCFFLKKQGELGEERRHLSGYSMCNAVS